jgi:hypothetical protein
MAGKSSKLVFPNKSATRLSPRGIRNNNPGNLIISKNRWRGKIAYNTDGRFEKFETMLLGARAHLKNLQSYFKRGENTIRAIIDDGDGLDWAPITDGNNSKAYIEYVSKAVNKSPDQVLTLSPELLVDIAFAMSQVENGSHRQLTKEIYADAFNIL